MGGPQNYSSTREKVNKKHWNIVECNVPGKQYLSWKDYSMIIFFPVKMSIHNI